MKAKKLTRKDKQLLEYENMKLDLYREIGRMEELRRIRNREYFPKELQKLREIFEAIEEVQSYQLLLFKQINRQQKYLLPSFYTRLASIFLLLALITVPLYFFKTSFAPSQPKTVQKPSKPEKPNAVNLAPPAADNLSPPSTKVLPDLQNNPEEVQVSPQPKSSSNPVLDELLASNYRDRSTPEIDLLDQPNQLQIVNRSDTVLYFELFDSQKIRVLGKDIKDTLHIDKQQYLPEDGYYFRIRKQNQLLHFGKL